jgi:hypothetical protein
MNHLPPQAPENNNRVISNFVLKFAEKRCTTGINDSGGKYAPLVSMTLAANMLPVSTISNKFETALMGYSGAFLSAVSLPSQNLLNNGNQGPVAEEMSQTLLFNKEAWKNAPAGRHYQYSNKPT